MPHASKPRIFTPSFLALASCNFLGAMNFYLLTAIFTEYSLKTFDLPYSTAALSVSLYIIGALAARILLGAQIDRWGIKRSLVVGYGVIAITSCLYVAPLPFPLLVGIRFVQGLGFGVSSSAGASGAALLVPSERRGEGIGYFSMTQALATGIGPFVAMLLINVTGTYQMLFAVTAAMAVAMTAMSVFVRLPDPRARELTHRLDNVDAALPAREENDEPQGAAAQFASRFLHMKVVPFGLVMLLVYLCYSGLITYMSLYAESLDAAGTASLYFVVYAAAILLSRPPMGRMADSRGENSVMRLTLPCLAAGLVLLGAAGVWHLSALLLVSAALTGFGVGSTHSVLQAVVPKVVPASQIGRGNSTYLMMLDLGSGIGPVLLGLLLPVSGYAAMYFLLAGVALAALVLYYAVYGIRFGGSPAERVDD